MRLLPVSMLALCACGPIVMKGNADLRLVELVKTREARPAAYLPLLADDVEVRRGETLVKGKQQGAEQLAAIEPTERTRVDRHHDMSILIMSDGRVLLMQRSEADQVTRAIELRGPMPGDGQTWQFIYYDKAWNTDEQRARLALLNAAWAQGGRYTDATNDVFGPEGVSTMIGRFRSIARGSIVTATTGVADAGGGWGTFDWEIRTRPGGLIIFKGFDFVHVNAEGQFEFLAGFLGERKP